MEIHAPEQITTERLLLRRPRASDAEAIYEYGSDPEVARYADWRVRTNMDGLVESLQARAGRWEAGTEFYWVITLSGEDRAIGGIACHMGEDSAELGFLLHRRCWGRGLTAEAAGAVVGWVRSLPSIGRIWASCDADNLASVRVLEKTGFALESRLARAVVRPNLSAEPRDALIYAIGKEFGS